MKPTIFKDELDEDLIKRCYSILNSILCEYGIPFAYYSLGEYMDDYECLEYCDEKWVVYTGVRGKRLDEKTYDDFYTASCFLFESVVYGNEKQKNMRSELIKRLKGMLTRNSINTHSVIPVTMLQDSDDRFISIEKSAAKPIIAASGRTDLRLDAVEVRASYLPRKRSHSSFTAPKTKVPIDNAPISGEFIVSYRVTTSEEVDWSKVSKAVMTKLKGIHAKPRTTGIANVKTSNFNKKIKKRKNY